MRHLAGTTFAAKVDAERWLAVESRFVASGEWRSPAVRRTTAAPARVTLAEYSATWLRQRSLKPRTVTLYRDLLERQILPPLGRHQIGDLTPAAVRDWYSTLDDTKPRQRAHAYALLRTLCATAVGDELLAANPCRIRGAGQAKRASDTEPATLDELAVVVAECRPGN